LTEKLLQSLIWEFIQDCSNFSVKINKNVFIKREVKKYASDIENYAYKIISSQVKKLVMQGIEINLDRYLKIANL
ncbi:hypothetical protein, partial [Campylobacter fetus]|uniref:hypothetical protein n=1 Tax=Campylobacter fetus TaxID=196 RepID=UPI0013010D7A